MSLSSPLTRRENYDSASTGSKSTGTARFGTHIFIRVFDSLGALYDTNNAWLYHLESFISEQFQRSAEIKKVIFTG